MFFLGRFLQKSSTKSREARFGRRKFRRQKFRRQKFRPREFRRISKYRNFVVRNFVVGNFVVLIEINSVREKSLFEVFNYLIIKIRDLNKFHFDIKTESKS